MLILMTDRERAGKYWICDVCVLENHPDWKCTDSAITVIKGLCGHCDRKDEVILTPIVDYDKPGKKAVWD